MIYTEMYGRLGNQFFRYAAARALQVKYYPNDQLVFSFNQINEAGKVDQSFYNVLDDFNVCEYSVYPKKGKVIFNESNIKQKLLCIPYYMGMRKILPEEMNEQVNYEQKWHKQLEKNGIYWFRRGGWSLQSSQIQNKFVSGCFEDPIYFNDIRGILLSEFTPKKNLLEKNKKMMYNIQRLNSVCLSVRRGDFESNVEVKRLQSICDRNYFESAIQVIKEKLENPVFFMFSDDIDWVKNNIYTGCTTYYEDGTDPVWEKLRLMSACKHFIVSNSTFSWWTQYLSVNDNKIVVSPSCWFNNNYKSPLIGKDWIKISV